MRIAAITLLPPFVLRLGVVRATSIAHKIRIAGSIDGAHAMIPIQIHAQRRTRLLRERVGRLRQMYKYKAERISVQERVGPTQKRIWIF